MNIGHWLEKGILMTPAMPSGLHAPSQFAEQPVNSIKSISERSTQFSLDDGQASAPLPGQIAFIGAPESRDAFQRGHELAQIARSPRRGFDDLSISHELNHALQALEDSQDCQPGLEVLLLLERAPRNVVKDLFATKATVNFLYTLRHSYLQDVRNAHHPLASKSLMSNLRCLDQNTSHVGEYQCDHPFATADAKGEPLTLTDQIRQQHQLARARLAAESIELPEAILDVSRGSSESSKVASGAPREVAVELSQPALQDAPRHFNSNLKFAALLVALAGLGAFGVWATVTYE